MKSILKFVLFLTVIYYSDELFAQKNKSILINGIVINAEDRRPIEGAGITYKGCKDGTGTMADGIFFLEIPPDVDTIIVTAEGFEQQDIKLNGKKDITISLKQKNGITNVYSFSSMYKNKNNYRLQL